MTDVAPIFELVLRGVAIGALAASAIAFLRSGGGVSVRVAGLLFCLSAMAYGLNSSPLIRMSLSSWHFPVLLLSWGGAGYFWLFVLTLFEDRRISALTLAPAGVLTAVGIAGFVTPVPQNYAVWIAHNLIQIALSVHALFVIYRSWRDDLVEARRLLRGPFVALYLMAISGMQIGEAVGIQAWWYSLAGAIALAFFCLAGAFTFLEARAALFGAAVPASAPVEAPARLDPADRLTLDKLNAVMDERQAWRREGITIGSLADEIGTPEHRLRRLINDHLGHRNFAAFVNVRRIDAAKRILGDLNQARTTVAAIAFDLGYGSLGPFNRAFKEATGATPTQWRRQALENGSPNPEIPG
jgi:AraC-like DNA-binding protein